MNSYRLEEIDSVASSIGKIVLLWGVIESHLSGLVLVLSHPLNDPPKNDGASMPFSKTIKHLKRCYRDNPRMADIQEEARNLLIDLTPLHKERSIIVHGSYQGWGPDNKHAFSIYQTGYGKPDGWRWAYYTADDLESLLSAITSAEASVGRLLVRTHELSAQRSS